MLCVILLIKIPRKRTDSKYFRNRLIFLLIYTAKYNELTGSIFAANLK
jgi:hypothetical protein